MFQVKLAASADAKSGSRYQKQRNTERASHLPALSIANSHIKAASATGVRNVSKSARLGGEVTMDQLVAKGQDLRQFGDAYCKQCI